MKESRQFYVSVLLLRRQHSWVAQCLEYDVTAQGETIQKAMKAFERTFVGQILVDKDHGKEPLEDIGQAPGEYWKMFEDAEKLADPKPFQLPEFLPGFVASATQTRIAA